MMTVRVLHAGDGYTYLTRQVAIGDHQRLRGEALADYYTADGSAPGRWVAVGGSPWAPTGRLRGADGGTVRTCTPTPRPGSATRWSKGCRPAQMFVRLGRRCGLSSAAYAGHGRTSTEHLPATRQVWSFTGRVN